jgi:hypothetical protein
MDLQMSKERSGTSAACGGHMTYCWMRLTYMEFVPHLVAEDHGEGQDDEEDEHKGVHQPLARLLAPLRPQRGVGGTGFCRHGAVFHQARCNCVCV